MSKLGMYWNFVPPPGSTPIRQLPHRFRQATVDRLKEEARPFGDLTINAIKSEWSSFYPQGWGTIPRTLKFDIQDTRDGISVRFAAAGRHLPLITALGGGLFEPGRKFEIEGSEGFLSFFWKRKGRWARFVKVTHPGWEIDYLAETFDIMGQSFKHEMVDAYQRGMTQMIEKFGKAKPIGRKTRKAGG